MPLNLILNCPALEILKCICYYIETKSRCGEMVDAVDSKSSGATRVGSNPTIGILLQLEKLNLKKLTTWGRFGLDRAPDVSKRRVGALFSVINEQKTINGTDNVVTLAFGNARVAQAA